MSSRCGMVAIVGRPNVGKSTLLNTILGEKVAIVSKVPQTTRNQIRGVFTDERGQIVFIDTPGVHLGKDRLDRFMNQAASGMLEDVDCIIYLVDTSRRIGKEEKSVVAKLKSVKVPVVLGLNKVDLKDNNIPEYIAHWEEAKGRPVTEMDNFAMVALAGRTEINIKELLDVVFNFLPEGPNLYPEDTLCDIPQKLAISDIIREKLFQHMKNEIPHAISVVIEEMRPIKGNTTLIKALIFVERATQKEIVIGKGGQALKRVGSFARRELEELLETKIFLECFVKVKKNWRDDAALLQELGYEDLR